MDVFTHALEACVSTERSDFSTALAEKSIELVGVFLLRAYLDGNDTHARQKMHSASCLAGLAFNSASLGLNHGMAHQLGAKFHIPHGRANAMLLPHIIEFNSDINKHSKSQKEYLPAVKRYATVAQILGLSSYNEIMTVRSLGKLGTVYVKRDGYSAVNLSDGYNLRGRVLQCNRQYGRCRTRGWMYSNKPESTK